MILQCNIKEKPDAFHDEVKIKMTRDKSLHDQRLVELKQNLESHIKNLEEQFIVMEN